MGPGGERGAWMAPRWGRWLRHALVVGVAVSLMVHAVGLVVAFLIWLREPPAASAGRQGTGPVELAVMGEDELATLTGGADLMPELTVSASLSEAVVVSVPGPPSDEAVELSGSMGAGESASSLAGGGDVGNAGAGLGAGGGSGGASFFGVEASGRRFAFVVDVSGSMMGARIEELRRQLDASIADMVETSSYLIVTFSDDAKVLGGRVEWTEATTDNKALTRQRIREIRELNGTYGMEAFRLALAIKPRPDAIYFMTDGVLSDMQQVQAYLLTANKSPKVPIHAICFMERDSEAWMRELVRQFGGSFTCVGCGR